MGEDRLLPKLVPRWLGLAVTLVIGVAIVAMVVGVIVGNVQWLIGIGGAGTAVGTLTLAYFTFTVAKRTTEELRASVTQATAATATALEAQRSRIDALAPLLDLQVSWSRTRIRSRPSPTGTECTYLEPGTRYDANIKDVDVVAEIRSRVRNLAEQWRPFWFHQGYDLGTFNALDEVVRVGMRIVVEGHPLRRHLFPDSLDEWAKHLRMAICTYGCYFEAFYEPFEQ